MFQETYDFSDVLIKPRYTLLSSRSEVNLEREFKFKYSTRTLKCIPIMAANMDTTGTISVMKGLAPAGLFTVLHKFISVDEFKDNHEFLTKYQDNYAVSTGTNNLEYLKKVNEIIDFKTICIDVANGYMEKLVLFCQEVRKEFPDKIIIAGNVVCGNMTKTLLVDGKVDIVKVGIGGGSACTTRIKTGVGIPQFSAIMDCISIGKLYGGHIISDGGITCPGDMSKAFGIGASFVMMGGQFSGHDENPGEIIEENGQKYKLFYGMSSSHAMKKHYGGVENYRTSEGRCIKLKYKGPILSTIEDYLGGVRSTCTYVDCRELKYLSTKVNFVKVNNQFNRSLINN